MNQLEAMLSPFLPAGSLLPLLVDFTWKAVCVGVVAVPLMAMLHRSSASTRHLGWLLILAMMMVVPFLSGLVPTPSDGSAGVAMSADAARGEASTVPIPGEARFPAGEPLQQLRALEQTESPGRGPEAGEPQVGSPAQFLQELPQQKLVQQLEFPAQAGHGSAEEAPQLLSLIHI